MQTIWSQRDRAIALKSYEARKSDFEGIDNHIESTGTDGHPSNPSATRPSMYDVFLHTDDAEMSTTDQLRSILNHGTKNSVVMVRQNGEYQSDYNTENFHEQAFVSLYPYGRGAPGKNNCFQF